MVSTQQLTGTNTGDLAQAFVAFSVEAGVLRLGFLAYFLSQPVLSGFVSGVAILIAIGQLPGILGITVPGRGVAQTLVGVWQHAHLIHVPTAVLGVGAVLVLWWARAHSVPMLGNLENALLWPDFKAVWPTLAAGATASPGGIIEPFQTMTPFWLPTINTALLLTSGVTLTIAHHALRENQRSRTITFMWLTVLLGVVFLFVQGYEYAHAYSDMNLKLTSGAYGSTFYMLTGFHGFHVFLGMLMLLVITLRLQKGHFNADKHFGFEGAAWYWHFVDVVWLGLYILVYWM